MGQVKILGDTAWRDFVIDGIPSSGPNHPAKTAIRAFVDEVDSAIADAALGVLAGAYLQVTVGNTTDMTDAAFDLVTELSINKVIAAAHNVILPVPDVAHPGRRIQITDGKGDAETNNITITGHLNGTPAQTTSIAFNYGWMWVRDSGTTWNVTG